MLAAGNDVAEARAAERIRRQPRFHPDGEGIVQQPELLAERIVRGTCDDRRFANEAANYNAFGAAFHEIDVSSFEYSNLPCWMIFDHEHLTRYGIAGYKGAARTPSWLTTAPTLDQLASKLGIPADALARTVERFNTFAEAGEDPDFGRGRSAHDTWWGDTALTGEVAATLGPLDSPPFYALEIHSGALGTKGGPRTDSNAQVLDLDGVPIPGLYAAGNVMASVMGMTYGGGGGTLGPAMVFGYLAGRHAAQSTNIQLDHAATAPAPV